MIEILTIVHGICSVLLIIIVLLQFGKGAEAGLFSGGGDGAVFTSAQSSNIFSKITTVLVIIFLGLAVTLAALRSKTADESIFDDEAALPASSLPLGNENPLEGETAPAQKDAPKEEAPKTTK